MPVKAPDGSNLEIFFCVPAPWHAGAPSDRNGLGYG